ncbi:glycosyltransferase [Alteromonas halophila]|uniref:Glycosyl transferase n=1 Tax=Alteromonas halophila TaxID=516698 RepID=A0A918JPM8_9ALTE|nr:glycosyltransferase [Alteromonas halophila]GGW92531.1 glycosyl transferase [Alteromonas halophila]
MKKVAFISHGHPELSKGGAEVASWNLYTLLKHKGFDCLYIARTDAKSHGGSTFSSRGNEVLLHTAMTEWFTLSSSHLKPLFVDLAELLREYSPDVVHIHHYAHMGIELFAAIRQALPDTKIVFTLHEFMAMCMHNGQMVKRETLKLCYKATANDCHQCFPSNSPGDFLLRKQYLLDQFSHVDEFISPSHFLAKRYVDWGLDVEKMHVIENVLPPRSAIEPRQISENGKRGKFAFFGQINPYKGLDILLHAITLLPPDIRAQIHLDVHGANLDKQPAEFRERVESLLAQTKDCVDIRGPYEAEQLPSRIAECDWVVIPSIWWENSPVVIQEAMQFGRPLIGSNIGGMKEKIENKAGLTFEARSAASLAAALVKATDPDVFEHWQEKLAINHNAENEHIALLESLFSDISATGS